MQSTDSEGEVVSERIFRRNPADIKKCPHCDGRIEDIKCHGSNDRRTHGCIVRNKHRHIKCHRCQLYTIVIQSELAVK